MLNTHKSTRLHRAQLFRPLLKTCKMTITPRKEAKTNGLRKVLFKAGPAKTSYRPWGKKRKEVPLTYKL